MQKISMMQYASLKKNGIRTLWVAIADVAHYVQPDSRLDGAARARATSVYLPHTVLPMLPPRLADDLVLTSSWC